MLAKSLFSVCGGLFCLALAYHFGAMGAQAQSGAPSSEIHERVTTRSLVIVDERGRERAMLSALGGSPSLILNDQEGKLRAAFILNPDGSPVLALSDGEGTARAGLQVTGAVAVLTLADSTGKPRAQVSVRNDVSVVSLMDEAGAMRAAMGVAKNAGSRSVATFTLFDGARDVIWQAPNPRKADGK